MIWSLGQILADDALAISIADRTFEHGLGLFETLRTWNGRAALLDRHRARMVRSAGELGLNLDPASLPDARAVAALLDAESSPGDRMVRITATGGIGAGRTSVWMRSGPLPPRPEGAGFKVVLGSWEVAHSDPMARHKSLNYWTRRIAFEQARAEGFDETLSESAGLVWEGSRTNLFVVRGGEVHTPSAAGPIVPGILRGLVLEVAQAAGIPTRVVGGIAIGELRAAEEVFLTNAVRGIVPVASIAPTLWPSPGPITRTLLDRVRTRVERGDPVS